MADHTSPLTPEEQEHLAHLVRSPGWRLFVKNLVAPQLFKAEQALSSPATDAPRTNFHRGVKHALTKTMAEVYRAAALPDPFAAHMQAFLVDLDSFSPPQEPEQVELTHAVRRGNPLCGNENGPFRVAMDGKPTCPGCASVLDQEITIGRRETSSPVL